MVPIKTVFKLKGWGYAFVSVDPEGAEKFRETMEGATYRTNTVSVKDGHARDENSRKPKGQEDDGPDAKRRKIVKGFPEGFVPTLKDIKEKEKAHKGAGNTRSSLSTKPG